MRPVHTPGIRRPRPAVTTLTTLLAATLIAGTVACGDDEAASSASAPATTPDTPAPSAAGTELCAIAAEINATDGPPTVEAMERYRDAAPPELQAPTQIVIDAVTAADGDFMAIFADPEAAAAIEEITAIEAEICGPPPEDGPPQDPSVTVMDPAATRIDVEATEYAFEAEFPSQVGRYSFVMSNAGAEAHILILIRLEEGAVLEEVLASEGDAGVAEEFESSPAVPGADSVLTADLGPGTWVLLCPIPGPEGHPHFVDGMIEEFTIA